MRERRVVTATVEVYDLPGGSVQFVRQVTANPEGGTESELTWVEIAVGSQRMISLQVGAAVVLRDLLVQVLPDEGS